MDWTQDCDYPFARRFARTIRRAHPEATIFVQSEVTEPPPRWDLADAVNLVYAPHWYDVLILFGKRYTAHLGVHTRSRVVVGAPGAQAVCQRVAFTSHGWLSASRGRRAAGRFLGSLVHMHDCLRTPTH